MTPSEQRSLTVPTADSQARRSAPSTLREPAQFTSCLISATTVMVAAEGEIDACNAHELAEFVERSLEASTRLIVDLRDLQFFGTQGFPRCTRSTSPAREAA